MSPAADSLARLANIVLAVASIAISALVVSAIRRRAPRERLDLASVVCAAFFAVLAMRFTTIALAPPSVPAFAASALDVAVAAVAIVLLAFHRRYVELVAGRPATHDYAAEYAAKEGEARALAQVNEELRRLNELKSEFLSMVSHELRTPLTSIIGYSRLLVRQIHGTLTPKQLEHQEAILRSAHRLADLINDLLDVSRLEAGRIELQPRPTNARQAVDHVCAVITVAAQAKQITVRNDVPAELIVRADPTRLQQVLVNLVGNAVKFTPAGRSVVVTGGTGGLYGWIAVEDTGVGLTPEQTARIWDAFYQVESPLRRRHGGSGLGLSIVRRLVELHGGVVRAESAGLDRGSRFSFTLPVADAVAGSPAVERPIEPVLSGREVLVVDDEPQNQAVMCAVIEDLLRGKARVCDDGERAVHEAFEQPPTLILLDLMLPRLSGWEVARRLRQSPRTREVPIVAVSALARPEEREAALLAGCDAYIAKPFTPEELARTIADVLGRQEAPAR